jgi:hypothetical protein
MSWAVPELGSRAQSLKHLCINLKRILTDDLHELSRARAGIQGPKHQTPLYKLKKNTNLTTSMS